MTKQHKSTTSNGIGKIGIVLLWIGIFAIAIAGYSYYGTWSKSPTVNTNQAWSCPMMQNTTRNVSQWWGCGMMRNNNITTTATPTTVTTKPNITYETMNVWHDAYSLIPETVTLTAGKSYKLIITPTADGGGCMNNMTLPGLDDNIYPVKKWVPVTIVINNAKAGTYELICGNMWMHQWTIVIQ